ncbi:Cytochrome P450, family 20, subfamily A [Balamuthia mandrillaris]
MSSGVVLVGAWTLLLVLLTVAVKRLFGALTARTRTAAAPFGSASSARPLPGLAPSDPTLGNLGDLGRAGSLHQFLVKLHKSHGDLAAFWWGDRQVVSLASPELWKQVNRLFDRPVMLFSLFEPLIGKDSIQYANGQPAKDRRKTLDRGFSHTAIKQLFWCFEKIAKEKVDKWSKEQGSIPLHSEMMDFALRVILLTSFGKTFEDEEEIKKIYQAYETCWHEMEQRVDGSFPEPGSARQRNFDEALKYMQQKIKEIVDKEGKNPTESGHFIEILSQVVSSEQALFSEAITYLVGGFHTTGNMLAWSVYFLAEEHSLQRKLQEEIDDVLSDRPLSVETLSQMKLLNQVLNESLRKSVLAPWAARESDIDISVGGYHIPAKTPMVLALGVVLQDERIWPEPQKFDPSRFSKEESAKRHPLAFSPFGFAGKRVCPGYRFAFAEAGICLVSLLRRLDITPSPGQKPPEPVFGLVTSPKHEIFITARSRHAH